MAVLLLRVRVWSPKPLKLHFEFPRVVLMRTCGNKLAILKFIYLLVETADCGIVIVPSASSSTSPPSSEKLILPAFDFHSKSYALKVGLVGTKLPLYAFKRVNKIETEMDVHGHEVREPEPPIAFLDSLILGEWKDHVRRGLFRYDITAHETKVISGQYGFIAQLNYPRHLKKRPTEFRVEKFHLSAPFDVENSPRVVSINVSPIKYGHVLLIPRVLECLLQRIDCVSFLLALYTAAGAGNPHFRLGYNSLGAFATINHLHFQASYMALPFPIQKAPTRKIITSGGCVKISELFNYPVRGLVFEGGNSLQDLSNTVSDACICLQENNIPYNVLIVDCGKRIFLFPQRYA
ncbi:GDP-L-galactose phosphorylase 1 [Citrus sinensis]|uniref:GDP-L-galactose phosphorylase 1 n=1 Tax=Citrus sinensis TaxID=2711 RepID=A0ACB8HXD2_CITSI|nr:GDP-L-galactose phosphorylase 1 [Citrus sinensis]